MKVEQLKVRGVGQSQIAIEIGEYLPCDIYEKSFDSEQAWTSQEEVSRLDSLVALSCSLINILR